MQLNPSEISELIKSRIQGLGTTAESRTQGTVISVTDGICRVHGLADVMQGEMLEFPKNTFGLVTFHFNWVSIKPAAIMRNGMRSEVQPNCIVRNVFMRSRSTP